MRRLLLNSALNLCIGPFPTSHTQTSAWYMVDLLLSKKSLAVYCNTTYDFELKLYAYIFVYISTYGSKVAFPPDRGVVIS